MLTKFKLIGVATCLTLALAKPHPFEFESLIEHQTIPVPVYINLGPTYDQLRGNIARTEVRLSIPLAAQASFAEKNTWSWAIQSQLKLLTADYNSLQGELKGSETKNLATNTRSRAVWLGCLAKDTKELFVAMDKLAASLRTANDYWVSIPQLRTAIRESLSIIERFESNIATSVTDTLTRQLKVATGSLMIGSGMGPGGTYYT